MSTEPAMDAGTDTPLRLSTEALLAQLIDYAGLFPPAKLDMAPTVRNYAEFVDCDDAWMLGRLIVPVARLDEFEAAAADLPSPAGGDSGAEPWHISALTAPAGDAGLAPHLARIATFNEAWTDRARIDVIELRAGDSVAIEAALEIMPDELFPFFELPLVNDVRGLLASLVGSDAGAKVRTGGVTADLYPGVEPLARFIAACVAARVPFKATAGLHHPLRHFSAAVDAREHGFLNVFVAAALAAHLELDATQIATILEEEDVDAFTFEDDGISWRDLSVATTQIGETREGRAISFGSCSFEEPREDLRALGLL